MRLVTACFSKNASSTTNKGFYITTPIYYVNANPHIGHLYSSAIADTIKRWQQLINPNVQIHFATGTDEHGTKIQQSASKAQLPIQTFCDGVSAKYQNLFKLFNIDYTRFIRTTDDQHKETVIKFWNILKDAGHIRSSQYSGWYCVSEESFLTESQLKEVALANGEKQLVSAETGHSVEWSEEQNYVFKLSALRNDLKYWLNNNDVIKPRQFQKIALDLIDAEELPDLSVSRPSARVNWGIRVPNDDTQTIYVWLDALVNYLTAANFTNANSKEFREHWPPDVQVIGKDILKFHGIYWPAFLMAAKLDPPRTILCHSHWTVDEEKMSKSKNNVVCPSNRSETYTADGLRYFLLRGGVAHSDGNYSDRKVIRILNSELADTLGNLLNRCCGATLNPHQLCPEIDATTFDDISSLDVTKKLIDSLEELPHICKNHYEEYNFYKVVDSVMATLHCGNLFFETLKPWNLRKRSGGQLDVDVVLHITMETLRVAAIMLIPIVPNISDRLLNKLNVPKTERNWLHATTLAWSSNVDRKFKSRPLSEEQVVLFQRIVIDEETRRKKSNKM